MNRSIYLFVYPLIYLISVCLSSNILSIISCLRACVLACLRACVLACLRLSTATSRSRHPQTHNLPLFDVTDWHKAERIEWLRPTSAAAYLRTSVHLPQSEYLSPLTNTWSHSSLYTPRAVEVMQECRDERLNEYKYTESKQKALEKYNKTLYCKHRGAAIRRIPGNSGSTVVKLGTASNDL